MSDKGLQRVAKFVSYIGHAVSRRAIPNPRNHIITNKVGIAGNAHLHISVHDITQPGKVFLNVNGLDCSAGLIGLNDVIVPLMSLLLQYGSAHEGRRSPHTSQI